MSAIIWYDRWEGGGDNMTRLLAGHTFKIGDNERGIEEREVTIEKVIGITAGIDSVELWACVEVATAQGERFSFYTDGEIHDGDAQTVGKHGIRTKILHHDGGKTSSTICGHDGWVAGCPRCEANEAAATAAMGE